MCALVACSDVHGETTPTTANYHKSMFDFHGADSPSPRRLDGFIMPPNGSNVHLTCCVSIRWPGHPTIVGIIYFKWIYRHIISWFTFLDFLYKSHGIFNRLPIPSVWWHHTFSLARETTTLGSRTFDFSELRVKVLSIRPWGHVWLRALPFCDGTLFVFFFNILLGHILPCTSWHHFDLWMLGEKYNIADCEWIHIFSDSCPIILARGFGLWGDFKQYAMSWVVGFHWIVNLLWFTTTDSVQQIIFDTPCFEYVHLRSFPWPMFVSHFCQAFCMMPHGWNCVIVLHLPCILYMIQKSSVEISLSFRYGIGTCTFWAILPRYDITEQFLSKILSDNF